MSLLSHKLKDLAKCIVFGWLLAVYCLQQEPGNQNDIKLRKTAKLRNFIYESVGLFRFFYIARSLKLSNILY